MCRTAIVQHFIMVTSYDLAFDLDMYPWSRKKYRHGAVRTIPYPITNRAKVWFPPLRLDTFLLDHGYLI